MEVIFHILYLGAILLYIASTAFYMKVLWSSIYKGAKFKTELSSAKFPYVVLIIAFTLHSIAYLAGTIGFLFFDPHSFSSIDFLQPNFASTLSLIAFLLAGVFVILSRKISMRFMGALVAPLSFIFFFLAGILFHYPQKEFLPATSFLWVHIALSIFGHVSFVFAFVFSFFLIIQEKLIRSKANLSWQHFFPPVRMLDDLNYYSLLFGLIFMTSGVFTGVVYAGFHDIAVNASEGRLFWSIVTIFIYVLLILSRKILRFRGSRSAWLSIVGFVFVACSLIVSGLSGPHVN